jgi:hypothetical protein
MPGIISPNSKNYQVGKGFLIFTPEGGVPFHLGNSPKMVYTPKITVLTHNSSMAGTKVQDASIITQKGGEIAVDLEEVTVNNLSLFFNGDIDTTDPDAVKVGIFSKNGQFTGRLQYYATNDVGPRYFIDYTRVLLSPTGNFNPISDAYNVMTITMTHVIDDDGLFGTMELQPDISTVTPFNVLLPFIDGPLKIGLSPAFAKVGEVMTANVGAWIGAQAFTYQWKSDGTPISGATFKTYTPVVGDAGAVLTVTVTAKNTNGTTSATSAGTQAVHS